MNRQTAVSLAITAAAAASFGTPMSEEIDIPGADLDPDIPLRMSVERRSRYYAGVGQFLGVRIDGKDAQNVIEYDVTGGWARIAKGGKVRWDHRGLADTDTVHGKIEPYWRVQPSRQVRRQLRRGR
jgi:hypothetical protein